MDARNSYSFVYGPAVALLALGVLVLLLRWTFGRGQSLVERRTRPGRPDEYGLLVQIAAPTTVVEAELIRRRLLDAGLRATLAPTTAGPAVMVFEGDEQAARSLLSEPPPGGSAGRRPGPGP